MDVSTVMSGSPRAPPVLTAVCDTYIAFLSSSLCFKHSTFLDISWQAYLRAFALALSATWTSLFLGTHVAYSASPLILCSKATSWICWLERVFKVILDLLVLQSGISVCHNSLLLSALSGKLGACEGRDTCLLYMYIPRYVRTHGYPCVHVCSPCTH